ncbi:hypothetical protein OG298_45505 (plasmid) [Streptomyces sp. NBC_01005]|uniref:hypothetical protein n=1 Tax=unclassified Streptomyces TaxID=2593676 RepID=UPI0022579BC9|nr:hypothetical protein [Streptomyces sp. NBC_00892]WSW11414.1 hypothetical protein OG298_45505 [Streptomyces sp. NBC_01005]
MTKSSLVSTRDLAGALRRQTVRTGSVTPSVRGSDWRRAVVNTVGTDGTITTTDGIVALRAEAYRAPAIGDIIRISVSSSGAAVAEGRYAAAGDDWTALPPASGFTAASGYQAPQYRRTGDEVRLRGSFTKGSTLVYGDVFATLPAGARPPADTDILLVCSQGANGATYGACRGIVRAATGAIEYRGPAVSTLVGLPPMTIWTT